MRAAETIAVELGRTLLVLDTAVDGGAARLYHRLGYTLTGEIPDYAFKPHGGLTGTLVFWKRIGPLRLLGSVMTGCAIGRSAGTMSAAVIGFGLGFFVALQLGPMSLFLIRSTLRSGWRVGAAIGAGIAIVDGLYAAAGAGGADPAAVHPSRAHRSRARRRVGARLARGAHVVQRGPRSNRR